MNLLAGSVIAIIVFSSAYLGVSAIRRWALERSILDIPNQRSSHTQPVPRGGGLAIVAISLFGVAVCRVLLPDWPWTGLRAYLTGGLLIALVSWLDDIRSLPNWIRFGAHCLGAALLLLGFGFWDHIRLPGLGSLNLGWLGLLISFVWIVGLTNAYNFMDGIDGLAGGQAVVAGLGWAILGWFSQQPLVALLGLLLAAGSLGFLGHNWPPARIFMGDVGSAFLGYTFAALAIIAAQRDDSLALAGALLVWPFIFDAGFTFLRRLRLGEPVFAAHRSHLFQRLVATGLSHRTVTLLYIGLALPGLLSASALLFGWPWDGFLTLSTLVLGPLFLWQATRWREKNVN